MFLASKNLRIPIPKTQAAKNFPVIALHVAQEYFGL